MRKFLKLKKTKRYDYRDFQYILKKDFYSLKVGKTKSLSLYYYEDYRKKVRECSVKFEVTKKDEVTLEIKTKDRYNRNTETISTEVEYDIEKETKIEGKSPSKQKIREWDMKIGKINSELDDMILKISEYKKRDLAHARTNLFVSPDLSSIAFRSLEKSQQEIAKLKIELEKLRNIYESEG